MGVFIAVLVCVGCGVGATFLVRKRWRFTDTPTSDAAHVFPGIGEVHGTVEAIGQPALAASDGAPCVWWKYVVERQVKRNKSTDWVTEEEGITLVPFQIRDHSGAVRVVMDETVGVARAGTEDIDHLSLDDIRPYARQMRKTYQTGGGGLFGLFGSNDANEPINAFAGTWRAKEHRLLVGDHVFITAHARLTDHGASVELAPTDDNGKRRPFELVVGDEAQAMKSFANIWVIALLCIASLAGGAIVGNATSGTAGAVAVVIGLVLVAVGVFLVGAYNRVHRARQRGEFAWSLIDVACEQRATTIPQLNTVVGAALANEQHLLAAVAGARGFGRQPAAQHSELIRASADASTQLVARLEAVPTLTSQPNVAQLVQQLRLLNDRVAFARRFYNDSVQRLADRCQQFPDSVIARLARVPALPLLDQEGLK
jgi:LemA protein